MPKRFSAHGGTAARYRSAGLFLSIFILLALIVQPVLAQTYLFSVPTAAADVYVNEDGTVTVEYIYRFQNSPNADPIDAIDIGVPTQTYDLSSVTATVDGQPVTDIEESPFVDPGIALNLHELSIPPGGSAEVRVQIGSIRRMLFQASGVEGVQEPYASFQFQPNYFGSEFVEGETDLTVTLFLPPGMTEEEPRYFTPNNWPGADEPEAGFDAQDRVFYSWNSPDASSSARYTFGAAFPARLVPEDTLLTEIPGGGLFTDLGDALCPLAFCLGFFGFIVFTIVAAVRSERNRRLQYLPPRVSVEGNGIKRGLTSVEAALLMQQPMDKILTMILFSVIKKGAARVVSRDPMKVEVLEPRPADLRTYEEEFLKAMAEPRTRDQRESLQNLMTNLVRSVSEKMRGFSRKETVDYYENIMTKAWQQIEQADTPDMKMQMFDEAMDWTMLDRRFNDRTRDVFGPRPVFVPTWWGRYDPTFSRGGMAGPSAPSIPIDTSGNRPPQGVNLPNLPGSDFAGSIVGGMQSFASNVVGDLTSFTGGVTAKTNPVPKTTSSGRRGGGGGGRSCACACACAGCACACAGGGR